MSVPRKRTYTIAEAAELTGLTRKAITRRVERGSLRSLVRRGRRLIPRSELVRAGLLPAEGDSRDRTLSSGALLSPQGTPPADPLSPFGDSALAALVRELLERLERQASEIAQYRAITAQAESLRWDTEVGELRARLLALEESRRPEVEAGAVGSRHETASLRADLPAGSARERIWLPPSAGAAAAGGARVAPESADSPAAPAHRGLPAGVGRRLVFAAEALLIIGVAAGAWLADLPRAAILAAVGITWLVVALFEWVRYGNR